MLLAWLLKNVVYRLLCGTVQIQVDDIIYDSRQRGEGCVFVCLKGSRADGHQYALKAMALGIRALVIQKDINIRLREEICRMASEKGITVVSADDTREALGEMSRAFFGYPEKYLTMIGITGTQGKTTTAGLLHRVLENGGIRTGLIGTNGIFTGKDTFPSKNTTPESYLVQKYLRMMADNGCRAAVMEVSSQALMCGRVHGMLFDYAIFTNISPDHIGPGEHGSYEEYIYWKGRLFSQCHTGIINGSDPGVKKAVSGCTCRLETFGILGDPCLMSREKTMKKETEKKTPNRADHKGYFDYTARDLTPVWDKGPGIRFKVDSPFLGTKGFDCDLRLPGKFNVANALPVIGVARHMGVTGEQIVRGLAMASIPGRCEMAGSIRGGWIVLDYAHNGRSLSEVLKMLRTYGPKRLICLFGCGGNRSAVRRKDMAAAGFFGADYLIITADNPRYEDPEKIIRDITDELQVLSDQFPGENPKDFYAVIPDRREAIRQGIRMIKAQDILLIAGKGHEQYQEIKGEKYPFDEHAIVSELLDESLKGAME